MSCAVSGLQVGDATQAYEVSVANGAKGVRPPTKLQDGSGGSAIVSEVLLYGDVVLRYISGKWEVRCCSAHAALVQVLIVYVYVEFGIAGGCVDLVVQQLRAGARAALQLAQQFKLCSQRGAAVRRCSAALHQRQVAGARCAFMLLWFRRQH
jgi:hypothetical protein